MSHSTTNRLFNQEKFEESALAAGFIKTDDTVIVGDAAIVSFVVEESRLREFAQLVEAAVEKLTFENPVLCGYFEGHVRDGQRRVSFFCPFCHERHSFWCKVSLTDTVVYREACAGRKVRVHITPEEEE